MDGPGECACGAETTLSIVGARESGGRPSRDREQFLGFVFFVDSAERLVRNAQGRPATCCPNGLLRRGDTADFMQFLPAGERPAPGPPTLSHEYRVTLPCPPNTVLSQRLTSAGRHCGLHAVLACR